MLKIEITDPHTLPREMLITTATFLMKIAGVELLPKAAQPIPEPQPILVRPPIPAIPNPAPGLIDSVIPAPAIEDEKLPFPSNPNFERSSMLPTTTTNEPIERSSGFPNGNFPKPNPFAKQPAPVKAGSNVEIDCNGLPWDARIHSRTKSKTVDGAWKLQRGVDMKTVGEVTKELESVMAIPAPIPSGGSLPIHGSGTIIPSVPLPPITQPSPDPIEPPKETFTTLMNKITELVTAGKLNQATVVKACQSAGIPSLPLAATRPDLIPQIMANIDLLVS